MRKTQQRLKKLIARMLEHDDIADYGKYLEEIEQETRDQDDENERPLLDAEETDVPGTWTEEDDSLVKVSDDE